MKFASLTRVGVFLYALASTVAQGLPSNKFLSTTTQNSSVDRIYGGSTVDASKYPYIVQLNINKEGGSFLCGGTLIASEFVVTAAHCVDTTDTQLTISATMGSVVKAVSSYTIHPYYNADTHDNDVAVVKLQTAVNIKGIRLAKADGSDNKVGAAANAWGWGVTENGETSTVLEKVSLKIISNTKCSPLYEGENEITKGMMCAWGGEGKDTCQGDSGGPLFSNNALVGIVSFGLECGEVPGVYTRVSYVRDFIQLVINGGSSRSSTKIATQSTNAQGAATKITKTETATTATTGDSTIQARALAGGAVAAIVLALCAIVALGGFIVYKRRQSRNDEAKALPDVYFQQPLTPATPLTGV